MSYDTKAPGSPGAGGKPVASMYAYDSAPARTSDPTKAEALVSDYNEGQIAGIDEEHRLKAKLSTTGSTAIAYLIGASWVSLIGTIDTTLTAGGNSVIFWGLIICIGCSMMCVMSLAEASSLWPVGNQEVWAYHLAPARWRRVSAHQAGWALTVGYILLGLATNAVTAQVSPSTPSFSPFGAGRCFLRTVG